MRPSPKAAGIGLRVGGGGCTTTPCIIGRGACAADQNVRLRVCVSVPRREGGQSHITPMAVHTISKR